MYYSTITFRKFLLENISHAHLSVKHIPRGIAHYLLPGCTTRLWTSIAPPTRTPCPPPQASHETTAPFAIRSAGACPASHGPIWCAHGSGTPQGTHGCPLSSQPHTLSPHSHLCLPPPLSTEGGTMQHKPLGPAFPAYPPSFPSIHDSMHGQSTHVRRRGLRALGR
jgi:hypothetical protein